MRILCDAMLGDLARDLRLLGFDVAYDAAVDDDELLVQSQREDRVLVTRDRVLSLRAGSRGLLVEARDRDEALREVIDRLSLTTDRESFLSRCADCGARLLAATPEQRRLAPPPIAGSEARVHACSGCGKLYWEGSHVSALRRRLGGFLGE